MTYFLNAAGEAAIFAGAFALQFLLMLSFRNPLRGQFFRSNVSEICASVFMAALLCISFGLMISGLIDAGLAVSHAVALGAAFGVVVPMVLWRILKMRARLDAADSGSSPFHMSTRQDEAVRETIG